MSFHAKAKFKVKSWDEKPYDEIVHRDNFVAANAAET